MTVPRLVALLSCLALIGIAVVALRNSQAAHTRHIEKMQFRQVELQQRLWEQEMELARLRNPRMIRERAVRLGLETELKTPEGVAAAQP